jgi:hypothetical protein
MDMMNTAAKPAAAQGNSHKMGHRAAKLGRMVLLLVVALAVLCLARMAYDRYSTWSMAKSDYQSVFLTNGQVYFGKMSFRDGWVVMSDVYYLQVTEDLQPASADGTPSQPANPQQNIQLVKLGNELHGPQDTMYIDRDKVLFWENMKDDAKVLQSIRQAKE